jgi:uncharacterized membrane protein YagU involved in acid resistance
MSSRFSTSVRPVPRARDVILGGGLLLGLLDIVFATTYWYVSHGVPPQRILQSIAAGVLGRDDAVSGGNATAALGALLHFGIALGIAAVYWFACRRWPGLLRHWIVAGLGYGAVVYVVMNHVIVPLSRAPAATFLLPWFVASVLAHLLLVGVPLAWVARRSAARG